jgi:hypothetical protein
MTAVPKFPGVEQVTEIFGYWPCFHDAEVKWLRLDRHDPAGGPGPVLELALHCFEMTDEIAPSGCYVLRKHTLIHFRFREVTDLRLDEFNHQNAIFGLEIEEKSDSSREGLPYFRVTIDPSYGIGGSFHTVYPEVMSATPCDERGEPNEARATDAKELPPGGSMPGRETGA